MQGLGFRVQESFGNHGKGGLVCMEKKMEITTFAIGVKAYGSCFRVRGT